MYYQNTMNFSEWLDGKLKEKGWSRSEAARRGNVSASMYDKVIRDHAPPGLKFIQGVAKAFKMEVGDVLKYVSDRNALISEELTQQSQELLSGFKLETTKRKALVELQRLKEQEEKSKHNGTAPSKRSPKTKAP